MSEKSRSSSPLPISKDVSKEHVSKEHGSFQKIFDHLDLSAVNHKKTATKKKKETPYWLRAFKTEQKRRLSLHLDDLPTFHLENNKEMQGGDSSGGGGGGGGGSTGSVSSGGDDMHQHISSLVEEIAQDACKMEKSLDKAERLVEALAQKAKMLIELTQANDKSQSGSFCAIRYYLRAQSALLVLLASLFLYMHSSGSTAVCDLSAFSTAVVMVASIAFFTVIAGNLTDLSLKSEVKKVKTSLQVFINDAETALELMKAVDDDESEIGGADSNIVVEDKNSHALPADQWSEPDATSFNVRGVSYAVDKKKVASQPALFKLLGVDLCETPDAMQNIAAHFSNRVAKAHARSIAKTGTDDSYTLVFNWMVPGPVPLSFSAYWEVDKKLIFANTPFGRLARPFFFGDDDEFRSDRFKFIPKIVEGNFAIKLAVKDTPTIMGRKLKQTYHRADHYFEIDVDIGSSSVARNVTGLVTGYAKTLRIDMALVLEGKDEEELPEVIMGVCTAIHVDLSSPPEL